MAQRPRFVQAISLLLLFPLLVGCKPKPKSSAVVVHLLRNLNSPYGSELDRRILDFQGTNPRLKSGQAVTIEGSTGYYKDMVSKMTVATDDVDLIVMDSADDVQGSPFLVGQMSNAVNVCAGLKACPVTVPAIIPQQVSGNEREAAQKFLAFLQKAPAS